MRRQGRTYVRCEPRCPSKVSRPREQADPRREAYAPLTSIAEVRVGGVGTAQLALLGAGLLLGLVLLHRVVRRQDDSFVGRLIVLGLVAKLVGSAARFTVMADLYGGRGDFHRYFTNGTRIAATIRSGTMPDEASTTGTPFMDFLVGVFYTVLPNALWVGFLVFALLSFVGALFMLQAFQLAVPNGHHRRFALGIFFLPTMVFWPSSLGKEAWLVFSLGLGAYGAARVLRRERLGYLLGALGMAGAFQVRPHMGALLAICFAGAFILRFFDPEVRKNAVAGVLGLLLVGIGAGYAAANFGDELPRDESVEGSTADQVFAETDRRTSQGGSAYESRPVRGPGDFIRALITVPFRPFPTEAHNLQAQLTSLEGVFLILLILASVPRLASLPSTVLRRPFVAMAAAYCTGFIIAFSNVGNFGILTRQRAQLFPFLLVLICLPKLGATTSERQEAPPGARRPPRGSPPVLITVPASPSSSLEEPKGAD
jgi:hypothetical protein